MKKEFYRHSRIDHDLFLAYRLLNTQNFGFVLFSPNCEEENIFSAINSIEAEIKKEEIDEIEITARVYDVGRSASTEVFLICIAAISTTFNQLTDLWPKIYKLLKAIKRSGKENNTQIFTLETLKFICIADFIKNYGIEKLPDLNLLRVAAIAAPIFDGTWKVIDPVFILIPDQTGECTHLYVIKYDATILERTKLPLYDSESNLKILCGSGSNLSDFNPENFIFDEPEAMRKK